eukprot:TRINITY_DN16304_c0_g1_i1.p2 TRINITY_DN16304_c0_g1~~TRINITY_DN16304_c0_g1_i1.p2  ORF type:complete len:229 (-),score=-6.81 TRINITY_DN16304_c0_g1_i1:525-1211(-)
MKQGDFLNWCKSKQIQQNKITINQIDSYNRGIFATNTIDPDEVILKVPQRILLSTDKADQILNGIDCSQLNETQILGLCLLTEISKGAKSQWNEYFKTLPQKFFTFHCFRPFEIELLQIDYAVNRAQQVRLQTINNWSKIKKIMKELRNKYSIMVVDTFIIIIYYFQQQQILTKILTCTFLVKNNRLFSQQNFGVLKYISRYTINTQKLLQSCLYCLKFQICYLVFYV